MLEEHKREKCHEVEKDFAFVLFEKLSTGRNDVKR